MDVVLRNFGSKRLSKKLRLLPCQICLLYLLLFYCSPIFWLKYLIRIGIFQSCILLDTSFVGLGFSLVPLCVFWVVPTLGWLSKKPILDWSQALKTKIPISGIFEMLFENLVHTYIQCNLWNCDRQFVKPWTGNGRKNVWKLSLLKSRTATDL